MPQGVTRRTSRYTGGEVASRHLGEPRIRLERLVNARIPEYMLPCPGFPLQASLYLDDSTLGKQAGLGLFLRDGLDPGKETFFPIIPHHGLEIPTDRLHTIDMAYAHGGLPGRLTVDGGLRNSFAHYVNHVWPTAKFNTASNTQTTHKEPNPQILWPPVEF